MYFRIVPDSSEIKLPCSRCIGCKLERSRQWAVRLLHENKQHERSSFITLTYSEAHLPKDGSLNLKHFQDFMKRLRKLEGSNKIRFFHAGEYGEKRGRPHYHAIIFGQDFKADAYETKLTDLGDTTWKSKTLDQLWPFGSNYVGDVTFESAAYVARYITKKITGRQAYATGCYEKVNYFTGEVFELKPEYATMSRRPGIGALHFKKYHADIYPSDQCVVRGHPSKPPKFYDKLLEKSDPESYLLLKEQRECALTSSPGHDRTPERLEVRERVKKAQIKALVRKYEHA